MTAPIDNRLVEVWDALNDQVNFGNGIKAAILGVHHMDDRQIVMGISMLMEVHLRHLESVLGKLNALMLPAPATPKPVRRTPRKRKR
jgi:hypothetical protein